MRWLAACGAAWVALAHAPAVLAQGAHSQVLRGLAARPLHERASLADVAVVATVAAVGTGRIEVEGASAIFGVAPGAFALKRAPSQPPKLAPGERCVLLLRGARPPYVLVDEPQEIPRAADAASETAWTHALRRVREAVDADALRGIYEELLDGREPELRRSGLLALADADAPFAPPDAALGVRLAEAALDSSFDPVARLGAAGAALRSEAGEAALLAALPGAGDTPVDPQLLRTGLRAAAGRGPDALEALLLRALRHPEPQIRKTALSLPVPADAGGDGSLAEAVARLAVEDPDPAVRADAREALERSRRGARH